MADPVIMLREQRIIEHLDMCVFSAERGIPAPPFVIQTCKDYVEAMKQGFMVRHNVPEPVSEVPKEKEEPVDKDAE